MQEKTLLQTLLTESRIPPISLELDTQSVIKIAAALFLALGLAIMLQAAVNKGR